MFISFYRISEQVRRLYGWEATTFKEIRMVRFAEFEDELLALQFEDVQAFDNWRAERLRLAFEDD